jgi:hypothetical protein
MVPIVSLAPRFQAPLEYGVDFAGNPAAFEAELRDHVAIARNFGPYTISILRGSDKFSVYPAIGRICGELLHLKTGATTYLMGLRVVCRTAPDLFREIAAFARGRFQIDRETTGISTTTSEVGALLRSGSGLRMEATFFDSRAGRQLLAVTQSSTLTTGRTSRGRLFRDAIAETLFSRADLFRELLDVHFTRHLMLLNTG